MGMGNRQWSDRAIEKMLSVLFCLFQAILYVGCGIYGRLSYLGYGNAILIVAQVRAFYLSLCSFDRMNSKS
jgi:hypothetical protein